VIAAIVLGGRLLLRPLLRWIAKSRTPEIFTAARCCWWSRSRR
jgi:glutathione-regulated potassium-efflux system ancillary protein KefC